MRARVLFLRSNPIAPDPRVTKAARTLANAGYRVTLLGWDRTGTLPLKDNLDGLLCWRLPIIAPFGQGLDNFAGLLRWQRGLLRWLWAHRGEFDVIHACDFDTVLPALVYKGLFGARVVYDIFDFYADHLRATPRWIKVLIRRLDLKVIAWVDAIILADDVRWAQIASAKPRASAVIYNTPIDQPQFAAIKPLPVDILRVVYVGLLQVERGLMDLLTLLQNHPDWHLDLAGFGGDQEAILARASDLPNVHWHGRISYQHALALSRKADLIWALYDPAIPNHRYASPNKLFEAMMLGVPVLVARHTHIDDLVTRERCGLIVDYGNLAALDAVLATLQRDLQVRKTLGINGRRAYQERYRWDNMAARLLTLYARLDP